MDGATISGRWALAAGRAATRGCSICHGPAMPGAKLCAPCKAAIKRARHETVSKLKPPPAPKDLAPPVIPVNRRAPRVSPAQTVAAPGNKRGWRAAVLMLTLGAAAAGGYAVLRIAQSAVPPQAPPVVAPAPPATHLPVAVGPAPAAAESALRRASPAAEAPAPRPSTATSQTRATAKKSVAPAPAPPPTAPAVATVEPPAPAPEPEPAPVVRPAPAPDRWQLMADAIAQCGREGFFAGVICEQRVRIQYCEGHWGRAPQCPERLENDHGR